MPIVPAIVHHGPRSAYPSGRGLVVAGDDVSKTGVDSSRLTSIPVDCRNESTTSFLAMRPLRQRVLRAIEREPLIPEGGRVLVALSGGSDSVALGTLLCEIAEAASWSVAGMLHVNHQLRGRDADADEAFCREIARDFRVPIAVERVDVAARAKADRISIEEAGHRVRYEMFDREAARLGVERVATGHTRDDLAETVLLRLIRGAGPGGLAGIRPRAGRVIRPLLDVSRAELRTYLEARGRAFRDDETNRDLQVTRNRIRLQLLPFLAEHFSPAIVEALARDAAIARADADWIEQAANEAASGIVKYEEGRVSVDTVRLAAEPPAVGRRIAKGVLERAAGRGVDFQHVERLLDMAARPAATAAKADFPGCRVTRHGATLVLDAPDPRRRGTGAAEGFEYQLGVPGEVTVAEAGVALSASPGAASSELTARGDRVTVRAAGVTPPLTVRSWRPGDVFRPLGLGGRKKLQDFFVDRKIARETRGSIPIVTDARLGIVWVVGHAVAEDFRVTDASQGVLILKARKLGGLG